MTLQQEQQAFIETSIQLGFTQSEAEMRFFRLLNKLHYLPIKQFKYVLSTVRERITPNLQSANNAA